MVKVTNKQERTEAEDAVLLLRRTLPYLGVGLLLIGVYLLVFLVPDTIGAIRGPQALTMTQAGEVASDTRLYASLTEGEWDCETRREVRGLSVTSLRYGRLREETRSTEIFYVGAGRDTVALVVLSGSVDCADLESQAPTGYVYAMEDGLRQTLTDEARLARYFDADTFLEVCGYCGYDNSLIGVVFGIVFVLAGGACFWGHRRLSRPGKPPVPAAG
jgi:hypothetical protein